MDNHVILKLAAANPNMCTVDRLVNIYWAMRQILTFSVAGDVVELGCNAGCTTVFLQMMVQHFKSQRTVHAYDSFQGLPPPAREDMRENIAHLQAGDCKATERAVLANFRAWGLPPPEIHAGWFEDTIPALLPNQIAFCYLDADFYDSTLLALEHVWPRLSVNGVLLVDDYGDRARNPNAWEGLPGVKRACDRFFAAHDAEAFLLVGTSDLSMLGVSKPM